MRLGLILSAPTIADQIAAARHAEARGFDSVWTIEFFNMNGFVRLTAVAAATTRVKLGTGIAYAFMRTPLLAAAAAMDIDELSNGRMILGLGSGTRSMNERWYSIKFDDPPAPRIREAVALVRAAIAAQKGGGLKFAGRYYQIDIPQYSRPAAPRQHIPVYIAAVNRGMIRAAAASADGLVGHPIFTRKYIREAVLPELAGSKCALAPYVICSVSNDVEQARREARAQIAFYYTTKLYHSVLDLHGWRSVGEEIASHFKRGDFAAMTAAVPDALVDEIAIAGRPDEARERLREWQGLTEQPLLYPPTVGVAAGRVRENLAAIADTFGRAT
ncbi:MAG TPA: LLM class flavin-dependent oxidoreductase [Myxococcota bacterium]|nr:LLM class flavin-dependent oxidoreductase [Myxococcota bacterium]